MPKKKAKSVGRNGVRKPTSTKTRASKSHAKSTFKAQGVKRVAKKAPKKSTVKRRAIEKRKGKFATNARNASELEWLDGYSGQSVEGLIALEGKYRIDSLVLAFEQAIDQKWAREGGGKVSDEEFVILSIEAMEREVNNGGWEQFFVNAGQFAPIIVNTLRCIRCPKTAKIAQKAVNIVKKAPITKEELENGTWEKNEKRHDALNECDNLYFVRPENIEESLFAFIKANRKRIKP